MADRVQLGIRVDEEVAEEFREEVKARKGQIRGVLGDELEKAMRHYIHHGTTVTADDELAAIREELQRVSAAVGAAPTDGGTDTVSTAEHTHAPSRVEAAATEKPAANAATEKKVRYLAACVRDDQGGSNGVVEEVPRPHLIETVKDEYGFRRDTAKRYVDELVSYFDLREHPAQDPNATVTLYVSADKYNEIAAAEREQQAAADEAQLEQADPEHEP